MVFTKRLREGIRRGVSVSKAPLLVQEGCPRLQGADGVVTHKQSDRPVLRLMVCRRPPPALRATPPVSGGELSHAETSSR
jgi:hypothetical protein